MVPVFMLSILLFQSVTVSKQLYISEGEIHCPYKYIWDKLYDGTRWKVYIPVMSYDLLHSTFYFKESSKYRALKTFLDVIRKLPTIAEKKHPCRKDVFVLLGRHFWENNVDFPSTNYSAGDFRICGTSSVTFNPDNFIDVPYLDLSDQSMISLERRMPLDWYLQAGPAYFVNCTVSEFTAPRSHSCGDAEVKIHVPTTQFFVLCPNTGMHNFILAKIKVRLTFYIYRKPFFMTKDQGLTKFSFHYQILDIGSSKGLKETRKRTMQHVELGMDYTFSTGEFTEGFSGQFTRLDDLGKVIYIFSLDLNGYFTPVIFRRNVSCNIPEGEILFYDGPVVLILDALLGVLKYWKCLNTSDSTRDNNSPDEVRGSLGALTVLFPLLLRSNRTLAHKSDFLVITWHAEQMLSNVLQIHQIVLDLSTVSTIHFHHTNNSFVDVVTIQAPKGKYVNLEFTELSYVLCTDILSTAPFSYCVDGFTIKDPMQLYSDRYGEVCSNYSAENLLQHYQLDGLTVGQDIMLKRKQYSWRGTTSAVIIASAHSCAGYINAFPQPRGRQSKYKKPGASVDFYLKFQLLNNYSYHRVTDLMTHFTRSAKECCKLQVVLFETLVSYATMHKMTNNPKLKFIFTSEDLTSPARFDIDLASIGSTLQFRNTSSS